METKINTDFESVKNLCSLQGAEKVSSFFFPMRGYAIFRTEVPNVIAGRIVVNWAIEDATQKEVMDWLYPEEA